MAKIGQKMLLGLEKLERYVVAMRNPPENVVFDQLRFKQR